MAGPGGTIVAGYANGFLGMWDLHSGTQLGYEHLHGPITHMLFDHRTLYVASSLGQYMSWDLSVFDRPYCELVNEVWQHVAVVWRGAAAKASPPDKNHRCNARRAEHARYP